MKNVMGYAVPIVLLAVGLVTINNKFSASDSAEVPLETVVSLSDEVILGESVNISIGDSDDEVTLGDSEMIENSKDLLTLGVSKQTEDAILLNVPVKLQTKMPSGCELISAEMLLKYLRYDITADDIAKKYLTISEVTLEDNMLTGPNPNKCFIGDPYGSGYGCYEDVIVNAIQDYWDTLRDETYDISSTTHSLEYLCSRYIDEGYPALVWVTQDLGDVTKVYSWRDSETDASCRWLSNEHCVLLVGYDEINYYVNDPQKGLVAYNKVSFKEKYILMGSRCVTVKPKKERYIHLF